MKRLTLLAALTFAACGGPELDELTAESESEVNAGSGTGSTPPLSPCSGIAHGPAPKPNLIVESLGRRALASGGDQLTIKITNIGCGLAPAFSPAVMVYRSWAWMPYPNNYAYDEVFARVPALGYGQSFTVGFEADPPAQHYAAEVDPYQQVAESDETDNHLHLSVPSSPTDSVEDNH